jgi:hypothetical protein
LNTTRNLAITLAAISVAGVTLLPADANAQFRRRSPEYRRPVPANRDWVVRPLVNDAERESNSFRAWFERNYSRLHLGRERDSRWLKHEIQEMDESMERLRSRADDNRPGIGREDLVDAIAHARKIDGEILRDRDTRFTYREWTDLRRTLNDLARLYDVRGV